jgi:hypothetical protein
MTMARLVTDPRIAATHVPAASAPINEISFCAWVAQAEPGEVLIYHRGFLVVDADKLLSKLPVDARGALRLLGDAAMRAAEKGLVHLVQVRLASDRFAYLAIARPRPKGAPAILSSLLLEAQAA